MDKKETLIFNKVEIDGFPSIRQVVEKMHQKMYNDRRQYGVCYDLASHSFLYT